MGGRLKSYGDHRIAMAFAVAGMFTEEETIIGVTDCITTSFWVLRTDPKVFCYRTKTNRLRSLIPLKLEKH